MTKTNLEVGDRVIIKNTLLWDARYGTIVQLDKGQNSPDNPWDYIVELDIGVHKRIEKRQIGVHHTQLEFTDDESNLLKHAVTELTLLGEDLETIAGYLKMIQIFNAMGHSGGSASVFIPTLTRLLRFQNLKKLTDDPNEWFFHGAEIAGTKEGLWQNKRNSSCFSEDGGKTFYSIEEKRLKDGSHNMHTSEKSEA